MSLSFLEYNNSHFGTQKIAYQKTNGDGPGIVFLPGFKSDLTGTKAQAVAQWASHHNRDCLLFDYFGHGASSGDFKDGTISGWREEVKTIIKTLTEGPQILIGSSFGGYMASLAALDLKDRIAGLVLVAPAFDMTERLMWNTFSDEDKVSLTRDSFVHRGSEYDGEGYPITEALINDGRAHQILNDPIDINIPIAILHGQQDDAVPWALSSEFAEKCDSRHIELFFLKSGDHRLSNPHEISLLLTALDRMLETTA